MNERFSRTNFDKYTMDTILALAGAWGFTSKTGSAQLHADCDQDAVLAYGEILGLERVRAAWGFPEVAY